MSAKPSKSVAQRAMRVGEGHTVDVAILPATKGGHIHYGIDTSGLPVPDRRLSSDTVSLIRTDYMMKLLFAQREPVGNGFLSMLVVQMSFDAIHNFLRTIESLEIGYKEFQKEKLPLGKLMEITEKTQQSAVVTASMILAGYSGTDGCMDFYYASPFSISSINIVNKISVEPVVRVNLPTPLLIAMSAGLRELAPSLPTLNEEAAP